MQKWLTSVLILTLAFVAIGHAQRGGRGGPPPPPRPIAGNGIEVPGWWGRMDDVKETNKGLKFAPANGGLHARLGRPTESSTLMQISATTAFPNAGIAEGQGVREAPKAPALDVARGSPSEVEGRKSLSATRLQPQPSYARCSARQASKCITASWLCRRAAF